MNCCYLVSAGQGDLFLVTRDPSFPSHGAAALPYGWWGFDIPLQKPMSRKKLSRPWLAPASCFLSNL